MCVVIFPIHSVNHSGVELGTLGAACRMRSSRTALGGSCWMEWICRGKFPRVHVGRVHGVSKLSAGSLSLLRLHEG